MGITTDGIAPGGPPGPDTVGSPEIIDSSIQSVDIQDGTITVADLAFNPFLTGPRVPIVITASATVDPLVNDFVIIDTTVSSVIASLPVAPIDGLTVEIKWYTGNLSASINGNGKNIEGSPSIQLGPSSSRNLTFVNALDEWVIT